MSEAYVEILEGQNYRRIPLGARHEEICRRLHERVTASMAAVTVAKLLPPRSPIHISHEAELCPDLALVTAATNKLWLVAEVINSGDHNPDTVIKKSIYEQMQLPRLWMVDPRYDNVEVYHGGQHGLMLKGILASKDILVEPLLPAFQYTISDLFKM